MYYKPARYHLIMAMRYVVGGDEMPALTTNKVQQYCNKICEVLWDSSAVIMAFEEGIDAVETAMGDTSLTRDTVKTQRFTDAVKIVLRIEPKKGHLTKAALSRDSCVYY